MNIKSITPPKNALFTKVLEHIKSETVCNKLEIKKSENYFLIKPLMLLELLFEISNLDIDLVIIITSVFNESDYARKYQLLQIHF